MTPKKFKEVNITYAENSTEYEPLPALKDEKGEVITCWNLTFKERLRVLFKGEIWLCLMTFNKPLQPTFMTTKKSDIL